MKNRFKEELWTLGTDSVRHPWRRSVFALAPRTRSRLTTKRDIPEL